MDLKELSMSRGAFGWWEEDDEDRKKRRALLERARNIDIALKRSANDANFAYDYVTGARANSLTHKAHSHGSS